MNLSDIYSSLSINLAGLLPELILVATGIVLLLTDVFSKEKEKSYLTYIGILGIVLSFVSLLNLWGKADISFSNMFIIDNFALFFKFLFLVIGTVTFLLSPDCLDRQNTNYGEYYTLMLFCIVGMMLMVSGNDLIVVFLGLETFSIALYVLVGFFKNDSKSNEAALKYFLLGAFSSAIFLYGISFVYGIVGSVNLKVVGAFIGEHKLFHEPLLLVAMILLITGFGFKIALVPFHMWVPDVYEGAPTSVTAFMSVATKAAAFAAFLRIFFVSLHGLSIEWAQILWVLSVLTMTIGNIIAISQDNIKRMLAYSSIAHAGYILIGMITADEHGIASMLFYLVAYAVMNLGAFGVVIYYGWKGEENLNIPDYAGMGFRYPLLGLAMAIFMFSLAGMPPFAGFVGKFYIFRSAVQAGYIWLTIIAVMNSLISVYYYLRVTVMMYMKEPSGEYVALNGSPSMVFAIVVMALATLQIGIFPNFFLSVARQSIMMFL